MIEIKSNDARVGAIARIGSQPIALAAAALILVLVGVGFVVLWRATAATSRQQERAASARQLQARAAQVSEQLVEKTSSLEITQQESIDQLQLVQDQLQTVRRLLAAQQTESKLLSEQVSGLTEAIDVLRQSFASARSAESTNPPSARNTSRPRHATGSVRRRPARSAG
jgi:uncharacterized protein HemX